MKNISLKPSFLLTSILIGIGHSGLSAAHEQLDALESANATDLYIVTCSDGTDHLTTAINAGNGPAQVSVLSYWRGSATSVTDPVSGDGQYGPEAHLHGGDGLFYLGVTKTGGDFQVYKLEFHCENSSGGHTGTSLVFLQNQ